METKKLSKLNVRSPILNTYLFVQRGVPFCCELLSAVDRNYVELVNPPKLSIDFLESSKQHFPKPSPLWGDNSPITVLDYTIGARIKRKDTKEYSHTLVVEWYQLSQQVWD